jgi:alpha-L-fucosidase
MCRAVIFAALCFALSLTQTTFAQTTYEPTAESVSTHEIPDWFNDAKLGIFVHWGVYSVPAWAPPTGELDEVLAEHGWDYWFANNPYAEWYANSMKIEGSPTQKHHLETYGADFSYDDFAPEFNKAVEAWNPEEMASLFAEAGARYVVLTTKHHDGFLLWPSTTPNPIKGAAWEASRDIVRELTTAVREQGMKMGLYYSGGYDWTFNDPTVTSFETLLSSINQTPEYEAYATTHWKELIDTYQPSILWNDLGYPASADLNDLFAYYYNAVPDGVVNNRFDLSPESSLHYDFQTPEYAELEDIDPNKWESTRGLGYSFGYNQNEDTSVYVTVDELVDSFVDIVSKNGNLLLNVGPMADGSIPEAQRERILGLGAWLKTNGEAIYGSRPWERAEDVLEDGTEVRYTTQGGTLYAVLLSKPTSTTVTLNVPATDATTVSLLGQEETLSWERIENGVAITLPELADEPAYTLRIK